MVLAGGISADIHPADAVSDKRSLKYLLFATLTIAVYDHVLTLRDEITLVWKSRWSPVKIFFLFLRYANYFVMIMNLKVLLADHISDTWCKGSFISISIMFYLMSAAIQWLIMLRVNAYYGSGCRYYSLAFFLILMVAAGIVSGGVLVVISPHLVFLPPPIQRCVPVGANSNSLWGAFIYAPYLLFEIVMFLAMCWRYLSIPRHEGKTFADIVFENGFLYFLAVFGIIVGAVLLNQIGPLPLRALNSGVVATLSSIAMCRSILHIRRHFRPAGTYSYPDSSIELRARTQGIQIPTTKIKPQVIHHKGAIPAI